MDEIDIRLLRFFASPMPRQWDVRASFGDAARAAGITEDAARARIRRLERDGFARGWDVAVNPSLLGMEMARLDVDMPDEAAKARLVAAFPDIAGARLLFDMHGARAGLVVWRRPPDAGRAERLASALSGGTVHTQVMPMPPASAALDMTDWRLVQELRRSPRAPYEEIARAVGASERTVRRRMDRLVQGRALFLNMDSDLGRLAGHLACRYVIHLGSEASSAEREALRAHLAGSARVFFAMTEGPAWSMSRLALTPTEADEVRARLAAFPGVEAVRLDIVLRRLVNEAWLDAEIASRAGASAPPS